MGSSIVVLTQSQRFRKARSVNATNTSFPSKIPTKTQPSGDAGTATGASVIDLMDPLVVSGLSQNSVMVVPYGTGDDDDEFAMRVIGWRRLGSDPETDLWVPYKLCELTCTMSTAVGVAGTGVVAAERFCDTLSVVTNMGNANVDVVVFSPQDNTVAHAVIDLKGAQMLEITFDMTTGDPTDANCLLAFL